MCVRVKNKTNSKNNNQISHNQSIKDYSIPSGRYRASSSVSHIEDEGESRPQEWSTIQCQQGADIHQWFHQR